MLTREEVERRLVDHERRCQKFTTPDTHAIKQALQTALAAMDERDALQKQIHQSNDKWEEAEREFYLTNMQLTDERDALAAEGRLLREAVEHLARSVGENYPPEIDLAYETAVSVLTKATPLITAEVKRVRRLEAVLEAAEAQDPPASANLARALAAYREGERPGGEVCHEKITAREKARGK